MFKKIILYTMGIISLVMLTHSFALAYDYENNPIDNAFKQDWQKALSTPEQRYVSSKYLEAWEEEFNHVIAWKQKQLIFQEDKDLLEKYRLSVIAQVDLVCSLEYQNWSDITIKPQDRLGTMGTGGPGAGMEAQAYVYKTAVLFLGRSNGDEPYQYIYSGKGAEMEKQFQ